MKIGLIKGRHEIPEVEGRYIFIEELDPTDVKETEGKAYSVLAAIKRMGEKHIAFKDFFFYTFKRKRPSWAY